EVELDVAVHLDVAPDDVLCLLLEDGAVAVPVDEMRNGEQRTQDGDDKDGNGDEQIVHGAAPHTSDGQRSTDCDNLARATSRSEAPYGQRHVEAKPIRVLPQPIEPILARAFKSRGA